MSNEIENVAKNLSDMVNGKGGFKMEQVMRILATDKGKKVLAALMADGGEKIKKAALSTKSGDMSGVKDIISSIAATEEGKDLLSELMDGKE